MIWQMVYANYVDFIERTGHQPVRMLVELNIKELCERIQLIAHELLCLIQRRWRGAMARRVVAYFKTEIIRIRQFDVARVMKVQRVYRGHSVRLHILREMKRTENKDLQMEKYLAERAKENAAKERHDTNEIILVNYREERKKEATLRYIQRIRPPSDYNGRKMMAYSASCYAESFLADKMVASVQLDRSNLIAEEQCRREQHDRKVFLLRRIAETGPPGYGYRSVPTAPPLRRPMVSLDSVSLSSDTESMTQDKPSKIVWECSRSRGMRYYFGPELLRLIEKEVGFVTHDFSKKKPSLLSRFKSYNHDRSAGLGGRKEYTFPATLRHKVTLLKDEVDEEESMMMSNQKLKSSKVQRPR